MDINIEGFDFSQGRKRKSCTVFMLVYYVLLMDKMQPSCGLAHLVKRATWIANILKTKISNEAIESWEIYYIH